jgi:catechol 2,3-dioxygenase-like lactoylglutathione lyase family enzyme
VKYLHVFSGFSVRDVAATERFYRDTLGLEIKSSDMGLQLTLPGGAEVFIYPKPNHEPASFTILNLVVADIDAAVKELADRGIEFEHYPDMHQDEDGIARGKAAGMGPDIAWFKDPSGNILSVLQDA